MSLLEDLRKAADSIGVSHLPTPAEVSKVLASLIGYLEHGDKFLDAAQSGVDDVEHLLSGVKDEQDAQGAAPVPEPAQARAPEQPVTVPGPPVVDFANPTPAPKSEPDPEPQPPEQMLADGMAALAPPPPEPPAPEPPPEPTPDEMSEFREFLDWKRSQATARATSQQTQLVEHSSGEPDPPADPPAEVLP